MTAYTEHGIDAANLDVFTLIGDPATRLVTGANTAPALGSGMAGGGAGSGGGGGGMIWLMLLLLLPLIAIRDTYRCRLAACHGERTPSDHAVEFP